MHQFERVTLAFVGHIVTVGHCALLLTDKAHYNNPRPASISQMFVDLIFEYMYIKYGLELYINST